jgi:phosphomannomutase
VSIQFHVDKGGQLMGSASKLPCVVFRTALLAVLRSKKFHGETIGIMITASHNPAIVRPFSW